MEKEKIYKIFLNKTTGLCNQLFFLFSSILTGILNKESSLKIDKFLLDIDSKKYCRISEIVDVEYLNSLLVEYNIKIVDMYDSNDNLDDNLLLINVDYGGLNITSKFSELYLKENGIKIANRTNLNFIFGDPKPFVPKQIKIKYILNGVVKEYIEKERNGLLINDIIIEKNNDINYNNINYNNIYSDWRILFSNYDNFYFQRFIIKNFKFNKTIIDKSLTFFEKTKININNNINVIHLRIENDCINHWCKFNNLSFNEFKLKLETKFINLIEKYFDKNIPIIVLSSCTNNNVITYLKNNNYVYYIKEDKELNKREYNAAIDLQIGLSCNNVFIGCESSTFSQIIHKKIQNKVTVLLNLENLEAEDIIIKRIYN